MSTVALPRPAERVAIVSMVLVFLCGAVLGAVLMKYHMDTPHGFQPGAGGIAIREWKEQLNLTKEQTRQLNSILDDFSRLYNDLLADGNTRIVQILNPDQKRKYEQMIAAHQNKK